MHELHSGQDIGRTVRLRIFRLASLASEEIEPSTARKLLACCDVLSAVLREHLAVHGGEETTR